MNTFQRAAEINSTSNPNRTPTKIRVVLRNKTITEVNEHQYTWYFENNCWVRELDNLKAARVGEWLYVRESQHEKA